MSNKYFGGVVENKGAAEAVDEDLKAFFRQSVEDVSLGCLLLEKCSPGIFIFLIYEKSPTPLLLMFFKEPLSAIIEKKAQKMEGGVGMFITQGVFELFEVLLSYFSNTLSFVRVGAFAVSHAAMMQVVLMLAGAEAGDPNWGIVIGGNLFVCGMEGLIVGIQVLRLEYYELFSRFYRGSGRAFEPYGR